jgi:hypothetical protein
MFPCRRQSAVGVDVLRDNAGMVTTVTSAWTVLDERQRLQWDYTPFECVGPLRFGMTDAEVEAAVAGSLSCTASVLQGCPGKEIWADFWLKAPNQPGTAVTVYYDQRAGDAVLSRPVFVAEAWAGRCWDVSEGWIPQREWNTF